MKVIFTLAVLVAVTLADPEKRFVNNGQCALTSSDVSSIKAQLRIDEGYKTVIYKDSMGLATFGIGHLVTHSDPEYGQAIGTHVSTARIDSVFITDVAHAVSTTHSIFPHCANWPSEVKRIIVNMAFNLGGRLRNFHNFIAAVNRGDWNTAANEMVDSAWYRQVGNRAVRLVSRMRAV